MIGRGAYAPGEWTDATAMAIAVAEIASFASQLTVPQRLDDLVQRWAWWARNAKNVGPQTAAVLAPVDATEGLAEAARDAAAAHFADTGGTLDATCLTRAVPVALFNLGPREEWSAVHAARTLCALTHAGPDAAVLWTLAVSHAVRTGELDLRIGLVQIEENRRDRWATRIAQAEQTHPADFAAATDDVVGVVQAAWSAITNTPAPEQDPAAGVFTADRLRLGLEAAVRSGGHTDTVAAVAGGLLGAAYGAAALPWQWRAILRGWPGLRVHGLAGLAETIVNGGEPRRPKAIGWWRDEPPPRRHPHDDGVWVGVAARLEKRPADVGAVVSLCPVPDEKMPAGVLHLEVWLEEAAAENAHLDFVLLDTVRAIEALRADGVTVFLHGAVPGHRQEYAMSVNQGPVGPSTRYSASRGDTWGPYWDVLFPPRPVTAWINFKRGSTGVNIARRFWAQREYLRRAYESVYGSDPAAWPSRHPGVVLDAVPRRRPPGLPGLPLVRGRRRLGGP